MQILEGFLKERLQTSDSLPFVYLVPYIYYIISLYSSESLRGEVKTTTKSK